MLDVESETFFYITTLIWLQKWNSLLEIFFSIFFSLKAPVYIKEYAQFVYRGSKSLHLSVSILFLFF